MNKYRLPSKKVIFIILYLIARVDCNPQLKILKSELLDWRRMSATTTQKLPAHKCHLIGSMSGWLCILKSGSMGLFFPKCRTCHFPLLDFMRFLFAVFTACWGLFEKTLWTTAKLFGLSATPSKFLLPVNLLKMHLVLLLSIAHTLQHILRAGQKWLLLCEKKHYLNGLLQSWACKQYAQASFNSKNFLGGFDKT